MTGAESQLATLRTIAEAREIDTMLIREPANIAWLLGCRYHVPNTLDSACLDVIVSGLRSQPTISIVSNSIEASRLVETELVGGPEIAEHHVVDWWGDRSSHFPTGPGVGSDRPLGDAESITQDLAAARRTLNPEQAALLATISAEAASATGRVAQRLQPGLTEFEVAGLLSAELLSAELEPVVLMVAADGRDRAHRHPLPTARRGESAFLLVCCARRNGLIASITRNVLFKSAGHDQAERDGKHAALLHVEQAFLDASLPGARIGDVVAAGTAAYAENGFDSDEWKRHHQGGLSGWMPREFPAHKESSDLLGNQMVVAWNPSGDGCKVEDTSLVTPAGVQPLAHDPEWPAVEVGGRMRPGLLWL